jgi:galactokinase
VTQRGGSFDGVNTAAALLEATYGSEPLVVVRAPGRVNLIGEHTDYSHLPVLPMAIQLGIEIAAAPGDGGVEAVSSLGRPVVVGAASRGWGRYLWGALAALGAEGRGARLAVSGDLPSTGGLASSSALTVGVLEALNQLWGLGLTGQQVVDTAIVAERAIGVESGGMDQTVIAFATTGAALRIDFEPPVHRPVPIGPGLSFVIGFSGEAAPKGGAVRCPYNASVVSCRVAAALLARDMGVDGSLLRHVSAADDRAVAGLPGGITAADAASVLGVPVASLTELTATTFPPHAELFPRAAARHVLSEATRVDEAESALSAGDGPGMGALFRASHRSLADFGASTPALDAVVGAAEAGGAWGARLTGAGFGGWAVAVCPPERVAAVVSAMEAAIGGPALEVVPSPGLFAP